jgi:hypothetical protein
MKWFAERWNYFWFAPSPAADLGLCRVVFYSGLFLYFLPQDMRVWNTISSLHWQPMLLFRVLHLKPLAAIPVLQIVWKLALLSAALGWKTRLSSLIAFVLGVYFIGLPHNFGTVDHYDALLVITLGIMSVANCGDRFSLDARGRGELPPPLPEYTWPIRLVWVMMALMYFAAGFAKVRNSGLGWFESRFLSTLFFSHAYVHNSASGIGPYLAQYPLLVSLMSVSSISVELGFIGSLFSRRVRLVMLPAAYSLHIGIYLLMGPNFLVLILVYVFWVPWSEWFLAREPQLAAITPRRRTAIVACAADRSAEGRN